jgi:TRAP-type C4-dicarboxylate transport system substrate-binding protein
MTSVLPIRLNISHYMPPDHGTHIDFIAPWATRLEAEAKGEIQTVVHTGDTPLGLLDKQYDQVVDGIVDVAHSPGGLPIGRFPLMQVLNLPFMVTSAEQGTHALWSLFKQGFFDDEYANLYPLALHVDSGGVIHTRDHPVNVLEDLEGLKLRCPAGAMEDVLKRFGAIPVPLTPPNIHAAAIAGEIDGAVMAWDVVAYTQTGSIFCYHTDTKLYASPLYFVMNRKRWSSLPGHLRQAIDHVSGSALVKQFGKWWRRWEVPGRAIANVQGQHVTYLTSAELRRWRDLATPVTESYIDDLEKRGLKQARAVYETALKLRDEHLEEN